MVRIIGLGEKGDEEQISTDNGSAVNFFGLLRELNPIW
tara:strand:- start:20 stop:133 length:114 start_codon:yes stop_codon:yes gene_type:complete